MPRPLNLMFKSETGYGRLAGLGLTITKPGFVGPVDDSSVFYVGSNATPESVVQDLADWLGWTPQQVVSDYGLMAQLQQSFATPIGANTKTSVGDWIKENGIWLSVGAVVFLLLRK